MIRKIQLCSDNVSDFVDLMFATSLFPYITSPTRITSKSQTLIENIFRKRYSPFYLAGNIITTSSSIYLIKK